MSVGIRTNIESLGALNDLNQTSRALARTFERVSTGKRIVRAADDAAGLGVAENLRSAHTSAAVAMRNANDGMSIIAVAESATNEVANILVRMRELAIQSASETLDNNERAYIETEYGELVEEIDRISAVTEFNGQILTDGATATINVQVGIHDTANDVIAITLGDLGSATLTVDTANVTLATSADAVLALANIDAALDSVGNIRSAFGAVENRLNNALANLETFEQSTVEAESRIRDADFGYESAQLAQQQVLQQAGVAVLSQAKGLSQSALRLLE